MAAKAGMQQQRMAIKAFFSPPDWLLCEFSETQKRITAHHVVMVRVKFHLLHQ